MFVFFAVLVFLFFIPVFRYIADYSRNMELSRLQNRLDRGIASIDLALIGVKNALAITEEDPQFRPLKYDLENTRQRPLFLAQIQESFNNLFLSQPLIADAGIIFPNGMALSRHRLFFRPDLYEYYPVFFSWGPSSWEEWKTLLITNRPFLPAQYCISEDYGIFNALIFSESWHRGETGESLFFAALRVKSIISFLVDDV